MPGSEAKPAVYLLDTMAFIFRAYHAMQRSRPMTTRTGIPTAATYVFVNMLRKLREDFHPEYLAAVYDVGAPLLRHETAARLSNVQRFNIKTQQFEATQYAGYKANRAETPPDLIQQQPYIRRALEAMHIPIVYSEGYEADDVIGTLSRKFAELGHPVFIVSSDKDMMQLVNDRVRILNPAKDNLILDSSGVESTLGVPPQKVIDVMALRGDSIDNVPGAPGIGDKGSVELIQMFGSVEAALKAAVDDPDAIHRKTYRESLANNHANILLSKELVTIHCSVPIDVSLEAMRTQPQDTEACRALFTELEFTTMLKELAPDLRAASTQYELQPTIGDIRALVREAKSSAFGLAIALDPLDAGAGEVSVREPEDEDAAEPKPAETMSLFGVEPAARQTQHLRPSPSDVRDGAVGRCYIGLSVEPERALRVDLSETESREILVQALADEKMPKLLHDLKHVMRVLDAKGLVLKGKLSDVMLQSYLLNPTHTTHTLQDIAARVNSLALKHQSTRENPDDPKRLPEAAAAVARIVPKLLEQMGEPRSQVQVPADSPELGGAVTTEMLFAKTQELHTSEPAADGVWGRSTEQLEETRSLVDLYWKLDLPLVPVLLRMEKAGVRVERDLLRSMSSRFAVTIDDLVERIYSIVGHRFNINSPKQLGEVLFQRLGLPVLQKLGKGKAASTAQDVLEELALHTELPGHEVPALVLEYRQLQKLKTTYLDQLPEMTDSDGRLHTTFNQVGTATGRLSSTNPNLQNIPVRTTIGREIRSAFVAAPGNLLMSADYSQIELRLLAHYSQDPLLLDAYRTGKDIHTLTAAEVFGVEVSAMDKETRARAKAVNFGIVYGISPFGLAGQLGIDQKTAKAYIDTYFERYKGVARFIEETLEKVRRDQFVQTAFGRIRPIPDIQSRNPNQRGFAERTAINTPLQGTAADLIKLAMLRIDAQMQDRKVRSLMTLQVHDELLFDVVPEEAEEMKMLVRQEMEAAARFTVPMEVEIGVGKNWRDIK